MRSETTGLVQSLVGLPDRRFVSLAAAEALLPELPGAPRVTRILVENLLRAGLADGGPGLDAAVARAAALVDATTRPSAGDVEVDFYPSRVVLQDHSGVPVLLDLAGLRTMIEEAGGDPARLTPTLPVDLVVDHSVEAHHVRGSGAMTLNMAREMAMNGERYRFLRWAEQAIDGLRLVPPGRGIVHQVNLEYLATVVTTDRAGLMIPDTVVGTDSHTPMINSLGVLGWGVGGIEATAVLTGQPVSLLVPQVVGVRLVGEPRTGVMATDLALAMTAFLREVGVVGAMVEFTGPGLRHLSLPNRATVANMAPEYGCTSAYFPIDERTLSYLAATGREAAHVALVGAYARAQGLAGEDAGLRYARTVDFDLGAVGTTVAGPRRPQDKLELAAVPASFPAAPASGTTGGAVPDGAVAIAAITSCTSTANLESMLAAGLVARNAVARGLVVPSWVKTSMSPGSHAVTQALNESGLLPHLSALGFGVVGYGCMTCIGNSGPLHDRTAAAAAGGVRLAAVLSGNRNFEGRIHPDVAGAYLASPPLVVAYALAGTVTVNLAADAIGRDRHGTPVYLSDLWPDPEELNALVEKPIGGMFAAQRASLFRGGTAWQELSVTPAARYDWPSGSTYIQRPPAALTHPSHELSEEIVGARVLVHAGDFTTTDHISPAGVIAPDSASGRYLRALGVPPEDFNSYGTRRGNHEVMVRGTFANPRFRNLLTPGRTGASTILPDGRVLAVHEAAEWYAAQQIPVVVLGGRSYGMGSSRDWAAKGQALLGVRAVLAQSFERIHRSNLVGVGILPLEFIGTDAAGLGLTGRESLTIRGLRELRPRGTVTVEAADDLGRTRRWSMRVRVDTERELNCARAGGFLAEALEVHLRSLDRKVS